MITRNMTLKAEAARSTGSSICRRFGRILNPTTAEVGRPSIDPELSMIRMLIVGYCFGVRSERRLCEEVHLNLAYRWFCASWGSTAAFRTIRRSRRIATAGFARATFCASCSRRWWRAA